ncbi:MAG: hypothetical protein QE487_15765 [Fluviicola sp.]|nr:hypothetical protein [Fluviicola sp.]
MKTITLLVFSLVVSAFSAQDSDSLPNGTKTSNVDKLGKWVYYGKERPDSIPFLNDTRATDTMPRIQGIWGNHHSRYDRYDRISGKFTFFYPSKTIKETGTFEKNQYRDSLIRYYENGQREYEAFYNKGGKEEGPVNYYYSNGQLEFTYNSNNGTPTGNATRYYKNGDINELIEYGENGSVAKSEEFKQANLNPLKIISTEKAPLPVHPINTKGMKWNPDGYNKVYNEDDEVWQDGVFKDGQLWDGKVYVYDRDGILLRVKVYKGGSEH